MIARAVIARLALALLLLWGAAVSAQAAAPDYAAWNALATRAERTLEGGRAGDGLLEALRADLAAAREEFLAAQDTNAARIATIEAQVEALGPVPEEGEEPPAIATRRAELEQRLAQLGLPRRTAEEAYSRASGLIAEIDRTLRARQAEALMRLGPSPLNPSFWGPAVEDLRATGEALALEPRTAMTSPRVRDVLRDNLALSIAMALVGLALIARARGWMSPLMRLAERRLPPRAQGAAVFALSAGQVVLPALGAVLIATAARATGMLGAIGSQVASSLVLAVTQYFGARWIGSWLFPVGERWNLTLGLPPAARAEGRTYTGLLGAILSVMVVLVVLGEARLWSEETQAVVTFPLLAAMGLMLVRVGQILARHAGGEGDEPEAAQPEPQADAPRGYTGPLLRNVGRASMAVGVAGPVLAGIGYGQAAQALLIPTVVSLALIGLLVILQQLVRDLYTLLARRDDGAEDALLPVLLGFALTIAALPVFALIWGARWSDITEVWARIRAGLRIGETVIAPGAILVFAGLLTLGWLATRLVQGALRTQVLPRTKIDPGGRTAIVSGVGYVGFILAALLAVTGAGLDLSSLAIVAGALSVGIGFGLQNVVNNFVSGIILLIERPISEGDWIEVAGQQGYVRAISVRSTRIETFDRTDVIVPNADLISGTVTNWTRGNLIGRVIVPVGVAYGSDTRHVERVLREVAESHPMVILRPPPAVLFRRFGADALEFEIRAILRDVNWSLSVETALNHEIARRFAQEGIEIPFAQRDVWLRNPETLRAGAQPERAPGEPEPAETKPVADIYDWSTEQDDAAQG